MYIFIYIVINEKTNNIYTVKIFRLLPLSIHNLSLAEIYIHKYIYIYIYVSANFLYLLYSHIYMHIYIYYIYYIHISAIYILHIYYIYIVLILYILYIYIIYYIHIYKIFIMKKTTHLNYQTADYCKSINSFQDTTYTFNIRSFKFSLF